MVLFEVKNKLLLGVDNEQMDAYKVLKHPLCRGLLRGLALPVGKVLLPLFETLANAVLQGGINEQAKRHHHHERHDSFRTLEKERGG